MGKISQTGRIAQLGTPLGKDVLCLVSFNVNEGVGELFEINVDALSEEANIDFDKAIGQSCSIKMKTYKEKQRLFNGILTEAQWIGKAQDFFSYRLVLRPWFWLLDQKADCRIFLNKNVKDIITEVFIKAGFSSGHDFEFRTTESYDNIPYCVQYRETDLSFASRLMEQYGIYYFFEHDENKHTMILADSRSSHHKNPDLPTTPYILMEEKAFRGEQHTYNWVSERRLRTGKVEFNDYDYLKPKKKLRAPNEASERYKHSKLEVYDYPGKYDEESKGKKLSKFRLEAEQALDHRRYVDGDAPSLFAGTLTTIEGHPIDSENHDYLVVRSFHQFGSQQYQSGSSTPEYYGNYEFQPVDRPFRMLPDTPWPQIYGIQTAKVVGKKGEDNEEISTDEHGHIWVQFYWDRDPKKSCPIRVAHAWSGKKWGTQFIPRLGMEVVVEFLEGDPDRPLVTGCVYNGDNKVPYDLPDHKTQSGTKSHSSKNDNGYNEFMFEDLKGSELIRMHAQKDHEVTINANQTGYVGAVELNSPYQGGDQTWTVGHNRTWTIQKGDDYLDVKKGNLKIDVDMGNINIKAALGKIEIEAMQEIVLKVGANKIVIDQSGVAINAVMIKLNC